MTNTHPEELTARRRSYRSLLALGMPILLASGITLLVDVTDLAVIGHYSTDALIGVAAAVVIYEVFTNVLSALLVGHQVLIARALGASDMTAAGRVMVANAVLGLLSGAIAAGLLVIFARPAVSALASDSALAAGAGYLSARALALPGFALMLVLIRTFNADRQSRVALQATMTVGLLNLVASIILIYGHGPFPELGALGSGIGSTFATWVGVLFLWVRMGQTGLLTRLQPQLKSFDRPTAGSSLAISWPLIVSMGADYIANLIFFVILGGVAATELAGGRVAFQVMLLLMILVMGLAQAVTIMYSRSLGVGGQSAALLWGRRGLELIILVAAILGVALIVLSDTVAAMFSADPAVRSAAFGGLMVVAACMLPMGWALGSVAILRAQRRTRAEMWVNIGATWLLLLPVAYLMATATDWGVAGVFVGLLLYWLVRAAICAALVARTPGITPAGP